MVPLIGNNPYPRNKNFTGRASILGEIERKLRPETHNTSALVLCGLGGVGKTQLAVEYAYRNAERFSMIWWVRAGSKGELINEFGDLYRRLHSGEIADGTSEALVDATRSELERGSQWLLIFDNADDPGLVAPFLPRTGIGRLLITSRNPNWQDIGDIIRVPTWERDESIDFLKRRTGLDASPGAEELAKELADLPLALAQAAAYISENGASFAQYTELFRTSRQQLWKDEAVPRSYQYTVATTWTISIRRVSADAKQLLTLLATLGSGSFSRWQTARTLLNSRLRRIVSNQQRFRKAVGTLQRYSLIQAGPESFTIHPLVSTVVLDHTQMSRFRIHPITVTIAVGFLLAFAWLAASQFTSMRENARRERYDPTLRSLPVPRDVSLDPANSPAGQGMQIIPLSEDSDIQELKELQLEQMMVDAERKGVKPVERGQHPKHHAFLVARFTVPGNVPEELRVGLFGEPKTYTAVIRFSNTGEQDDRVPDNHGMAIKVFGVKPTSPWEKAKEAETQTQDFVLLDHPLFFTPNVASLVAFSKKKKLLVLGERLTGKALLEALKASFPSEVRLLEGMKKHIKSPLEEKYFSTTPYRLGKTAVKYSAKPERVKDFLYGAEQSKDYLREALVEQLRLPEHPASARATRHPAATFGFCVQRQSDPSAMPIEDPTVEWKSVWEKVATIEIDAQDFDLPERWEWGNRLSFSPWHALDEHRPLGGINRARSVVYRASSDLRHQYLNGQ